MTTRQGDLALLNDPVAQRLLQAPIPAQLAYTWTDGTPRVVPIGFYWDGSQIILGTPPTAPKMKVLTRNPKVALTINTDEPPFKVLLVRGTAAVQVMDGIVPEYVLMARRLMGAGAEPWLDQVRAMLPAMGGMARVAITPEWVGILDFEQRFPNAIEQAMAVGAT
jgi:Pyridoxamine 5'-phosphate oxidase